MHSPAGAAGSRCRGPEAPVPEAPVRGRGSLQLAIAVAAILALVAACSLGTDGAASATPATSTSAVPSGNRPFKPTPLPSPTFGRYVVRKGDTLAAIAERFGTSVESLGYWNRTRYPSLDPDSPRYRPDQIQAGWTLRYLPDSEVDPNNLPPGPSAATSPRATPSVGPFPSLPASGAALLVLRGPANSDEVALTLDYAGGAGAGAGAGEGADAIIQWLAAQGVPATVFAAPAAAGDATSQAVLRRIGEAAPGGTLRAGILVPASMLAAANGAAAMRTADASLAAIIGGTTAPWFRASGTLTAPELATAGAAGWRWAVGWDVDPGDGVLPADGGPIAEDIMARVVSRARGGSIVHLSLGGTYTLEALPDILDGLASSGLRVVSLAELLGVSSAP
jgi:peptidoglycan/xylan/chitin deacetylase (PgdA/CDA1 family)